VQACARASRMPGAECAQDRATHHGRARRHRRRHGLVGRAQPVGVLHGDHPAAGQRPGEDHDTRGGGAHGGTAAGGQVDAAVAGTVAVRRCHERPDHRRSGRTERPAVRGTRRAGPVRLARTGYRPAGRAPRHGGRGRHHRNRRRRHRGRPRRRRPQDRARQRDEHRDRPPAHPWGYSRPGRAAAWRPRLRGGVCGSVHADTLARRGRSGPTSRPPVDGWSCMGTTAGQERMRQWVPRVRGVCSVMRLDIRGDFARPRTPSIPALVGRRERYPGGPADLGRSMRCRRVRDRRVRAPTRRQGGAADRRSATTVRAVRAGPRRSER
jgi:hypothetical protein